MNNNNCGGFADDFSEIAKIFDSNKIQRNNTMNELSALGALVSILPTAIEAMCKCDEIISDHEHRKEQKYSKKQFLMAIHHMYESGQMSAEDVMKASELIYKSSNTIDVQVDPVSEKIKTMINIL